MVYTARINEYVHNAATTQGPVTEGVEADKPKGDDVATKVVQSPRKSDPKKNQDVETK